MAWFLGAFAGQGGKNLGIYNCRDARGSSTLSLHGEGRACDFGIHPHGAPYGTLLAERLRLSSGELGIQCIIWNRRIWSGSYPDSGWRSYSGTNPHVDHLHVELSRTAARSLTAEQIQRVLNPAAAVPAPLPPSPSTRKDIVLDNMRLAGDGVVRLICPVGRASAVTAKAYLSAACNGPAQASVRGWFQDDQGGISEFAWELGHRDGHSDRRYVEFPDGSTMVNIHYSFPDGGTLLLEAMPK